MRWGLAATDPNGYRRQLAGATHQLAGARQRLADASEPETGYDAARREALLAMLDASRAAVFERMVLNGRLEDAAALAWLVPPISARSALPAPHTCTASGWPRRADTPRH